MQVYQKERERVCGGTQSTWKPISETSVGGCSFIMAVTWPVSVGRWGYIRRPEST